MSQQLAVPPKTVWGLIWKICCRYKKLLLFTQLFGLAWAFNQTFLPFILKSIVDTIGQLQDRTLLWSALATPIFWGVILWGGCDLSYRLCGWGMARLLPRIEAWTYRLLFDYLQGHSLSYFQTHLSGSITNKVVSLTTDIICIFKSLVSFIVPCIAAVVIIFILFARVHLFFALLLLGWVLLHTLLSLLWAKPCNRASRKYAHLRSLLTGQLLDSLTNIFSVKLFAREPHEAELLAAQQKGEMRSHFRALMTTELLRLFLGISCFTAIGLGMSWVVLKAWQQSEISTGELVFAFNATWNMTMMIWLVGREIPLLFQWFGICQSALTLLREEHCVTDAPNAQPLVITQGEIVFEGVSFHYGKAHRLFQNKNLKITGGEKVGLVGLSGSGKTTFAHLILRYFNLEEGRILIDGQEVAAVTQRSLRQQIALVPQDVNLFHRSLLDNIRYARLEASDEEVFEAAKKARCHEFILQLPEGYQTIVGERGAQLSGGQRQRIAIARAFLSNAKILLLDEATSALDSTTEKEVQDALSTLMEGKTCLVIAHRLSTLSQMERLLVFHEGKIVEDGTPAALLAKNGYYAALWQKQQNGLLPA